MKDQKQQMEWGTRVGVILAVSGSAVGLGNFLRFPGQAAAHGWRIYDSLCLRVIVSRNADWLGRMGDGAARRNKRITQWSSGGAGLLVISAFLRCSSRWSSTCTPLYRGLVPSVLLGISHRYDPAKGDHSRASPGRRQNFR